MTYTMTAGRSTIKINTETGNISGDTYAMRQMIKDNFDGAVWVSADKVWHCDNAAAEIEAHMDYYKRVYHLTEVEAAKTVETTASGYVVTRLCPHCHTFCNGDCQCH